MTFAEMKGHSHTRIDTEICFHYFYYMCFVYADSLLQLTAIEMTSSLFLHLFMAEELENIITCIAK